MCGHIIHAGFGWIVDSEGRARQRARRSNTDVKMLVWSCVGKRIVIVDEDGRG
jgi:hypothetical protein